MSKTGLGLSAISTSVCTHGMLQRCQQNKVSGQISLEQTVVHKPCHHHLALFLAEGRYRVLEMGLSVQFRAALQEEMLYWSV